MHPSFGYRLGKKKNFQRLIQCSNQFDRILCCIIRYGAQMRAWVDIVGYSSASVEMSEFNEDDVEFSLTPSENQSQGV